MKKSKLDIQEKDVVVLAEEKGSPMGSILRLVRYVVNGKDGELLLEKRGMFGEKMGRRMGMSYEDFQFLLSEKEKIEGLMK